MKIITTSIVLLALAGTARADLEVVATVPDLAAITKEIGGGKVNVTALSLPTQDPHFVDAKPSALLKLNKADLLIAVGLELEVGWLPTLQTGARNPKILSGASGYLECSTFVHVLEAPKAAVDRSQGDVHPQGNPHYLYDPRAAALCAKGIAQKLEALDASNAKTYEKNLAAFLAKLDTARKGWEKQMEPFKGKPVITYHRSWTYVIDWLGLVEIANLEPKPGIPPSPSHVVDVLKLARAQGAKVVLQEAYYPDKTGALCAQKLGGSVVKLPAGADIAGGESYIEHVSKVIDALA
ncbi:MAG TPA: zinc ABC transporter substrate-binding protein, partial [Kofleriaceae bacterium]|nr:zinc ABC transporter substrate-binding protein [Kofleriaceae bacterium]